MRLNMRLSIVGVLLIALFLAGCVSQNQAQGQTGLGQAGFLNGLTSNAGAKNTVLSHNGELSLDLHNVSAQQDTLILYTSTQGSAGSALLISPLAEGRCLPNGNSLVQRFFEGYVSGFNKAGGKAQYRVTLTNGSSFVGELTLGDFVKIKTRDNKTYIFRKDMLASAEQLSEQGKPCFYVKEANKGGNEKALAYSFFNGGWAALYTLNRDTQAFYAEAKLTLPEALKGKLYRAVLAYGGITLPSFNRYYPLGMVGAAPMEKVGNTEGVQELPVSQEASTTYFFDLGELYVNETTLMLPLAIEKPKTTLINELDFSPYSSDSPSSGRAALYLNISATSPLPTGQLLILRDGLVEAYAQLPTLAINESRMLNVGQSMKVLYSLKSTFVKKEAASDGKGSYEVCDVRVEVRNVGKYTEPVLVKLGASSQSYFVVDGNTVKHWQTSFTLAPGQTKTVAYKACVYKARYWQ